MPLISAHNVNDGRVRCRMMAASALRSLEDHSHRDENFDELQNAYRMLKSYRLGIFGNPTSYGVGQAVVDEYSEEEEESTGTEYLVEAFERAKNSAFSDKSIDSEKAASRLQEALQQFINVEQIGPDEKQTLELTKKFFRALVKELA